MKVKFMPMNVEHEIEFNETVLHLAQRHDIHIQSVCKGLPSCAECRICIKDGEHHVPPPSSKELSLIGTAYYIDQSRLSCQLRCFGDVTVDLTEQIEKEKRVSKRPQGRATRADGEESFAVKGVLIEEYTETQDLVTKIDAKEERPGHDDFYKSFNKNDGQKNNQRGGGGGNRNQQRDARGGNSGGNRNQQRDGRAGNEGGNNRNKRRDRNRNRNGKEAGGRSEGGQNHQQHRDRNRGGRHQGGEPRQPSENRQEIQQTIRTEIDSKNQ